jgi:nitrogen fixation protein FixH
VCASSRIFAKIEDTISINSYNARLQEFMEGALQEEARAALMSAAAGTTHGGEGRVTLSVVHTSVNEVKHEVQDVKGEVKRQVQEVKGEILGLKLGLSALEAKLDAVLARL